MVIINPIQPFKCDLHVNSVQHYIPKIGPAKCIDLIYTLHFYIEYDDMFDEHPYVTLNLIFMSDLKDSAPRIFTEFSKLLNNECVKISPINYSV